MYRLLVVDDEELIRQGILARLAYLEQEFDCIYEAASGQEALDILRRETVNIVITDIRMPDMDGLTFIEKAKEDFPDIKFLLLTGYAEFAYAEKAISLGVIAYLLKPLSNQELKDALEKIYSQITEETKLKSIVSSSYKLQKEKSDYLLEREINELVNNLEFGGKDRYPYLRKQYPFIAGHRSYAIYFGVVHIESESYDNGSFSKQDADLLCFSVKNVFYEIPSSGTKLIVSNLVNLQELYVIFAKERKEVLREEVEHVFLKMQALFEKKMDVILTMGISACGDKVNQDSRKEAKEALNQRLLHGKRNVYFYEDLKMLEGSHFPTSEVNMLDHYLERRDVENVRRTVGRIFSEELIIRYGANYIRIMWVRILNLVLHRFTTGAGENDKTEQILFGFGLVDEVSSMEELAQRLDEIIIGCMVEDGAKDANSKNKITLAISYMEEHYHENILINEMAERYGMSPNYFSATFKKETGQSAVNYLTLIRMKEAAQALVNTDDSIAEISRRVGYEDSQYFFRVFKKAMGLTPLMYRKSHRETL